MNWGNNQNNVKVVGTSRLFKILFAEQLPRALLRVSWSTTSRGQIPSGADWELEDARQALVVDPHIWNDLN